MIPIVDFCSRCGRKIVFGDFALQSEIHAQRIANNSFLSRALQKDVTPQTLDEIRKKIKVGMFNVSSVFGLQGKGKTVFGEDLVQFHVEVTSKEFDLQKHLGFSYASTLGNLLKAETEDSVFQRAFLTDEQESEYGTGRLRERAQIKAVVNVARRLQPDMIFISPDLREHNHHYVFQLFDFGYEPESVVMKRIEDGKIPAFLEKSFRENTFYDRESGELMMRTHTRALVIGQESPDYIGYFVSEFPTLFKPEFYMEYDERKLRFINNLLGAKGSERYQQKQELVNRLIDDETYDKISKMKGGKSMRVLYVKSLLAGWTDEEYKEVVGMVDLEKFRRVLKVI